MNLIRVNKANLPILILAFFVFITNSYCQEKIRPDVAQIKNPSNLLIAPSIFYLEDKTERSIEQSLYDYLEGNFNPLGNQYVFNKGYTESIWWFGFSLENGLDEINQLIFSPVGAAIREGILYTFTQSGELVNTQYSGFKYGGDQRDINSRITSYNLKFEPGETLHFLLKVDSRGLNTYIPFYLDSVNEYWEYEIHRTAIYGTVTGILLLATLFSIFFWIYLKDRMYLAFGAYILSCLILILEEDGFLHLWFYGKYFGDLSAVIIPLFSLLMSLFLLLFIYRFFDLKKDNFTWHFYARNYSFFLFGVAALVLSTLFYQEYYSLNKWINWAGQVFALVNVAIVLMISLTQVKRQDKQVYFFIAASAVLLFGFSNYLLNLQGVTNWHPLKPNGLIFGSLANVLVFTFGLTSRYNQIKKERERLVFEKSEQEIINARNIIEAQETERQRIAKDLHDDFGGLLAMIKLKVESLLSDIFNSDEKKAAIEEAQKLIEIACKDLRFIAHELMPVEASDRKLSEMVSEVLILVKAQNRLKINYDIGELPFLSLDTKINLFRIIKELLNNIIKHSEASEADVQVFFDEVDQNVTLMVSDNGKGIPKEMLQQASTGLGIGNLRKRVKYLKGNIQFDVNGHGTTVIVTVPLEANAVKYG
ncbi:7TM diverse intracellular signaling domain-containing protein [Algoriphagus sp.]|uniref:sensor histidine kinase n=1 Tax=Algoriphagus sp. TaxID=1872435 RepID=UPI003918DFD2